MIEYVKIQKSYNHFYRWGDGVDIWSYLLEKELVT